MKARTLLFLSATLMVACGKRSQPESTGSPPPVTQAPAPTSTGLVWDVPSAWASVPNPSKMRKATYRVPRAEGDIDDGEISVMQAGGSVDANVDRWAKQFENGKAALKRDARTVGAYKVTVVEVQGTLLGTNMPTAPINPTGPKPNWALLGAIVETPSGLWFFKLLGPQKSVAAARADFDKLVMSMRAG